MPDGCRLAGLSPPGTVAAKQHATGHVGGSCAPRCGQPGLYAAFCYARNYARDHLGFPPREDAEDHGRLRAHLKQKRRRATADSLDRLREWRNACDYLDELPGDLKALLT